MFPDVILGVVTFRKIDNTSENAEVMEALRQEEMRVAEQFRSISISEHPHIAPWREAYRKFGAKPKDHLSSIENLVRRVTKGHQIPHINLLVDLYNTISLRHIVPVGGEDLDKIQGDVFLTVASLGEIPVRLLGEAEEKSPREGEVIYKDDLGAICRRWNWKEADRTKFTKETTKGFLVIEGLLPVHAEAIKSARADLTSLIRKFCGGIVNEGMVSKHAPDMDL